MGIARGIKKVAAGAIEGVAQAATVAAVTPLAAATTIAGGTLKHTAKGIGKGFKTVGNMKRKLLGEASEAAVKGASVVSDAAPPANFKYRSRVQDGVEIFERQSLEPPKKKGKKHQPQWESISNKEYAEARRRNGTSDAEFSDRLLPAVMDDAGEEAAGGILNTAHEFWDGLPNWAKTAGVATAGGIAGAVLFGDDDDDY